MSADHITISPADSPVCLFVRRLGVDCTAKPTPTDALKLIAQRHGLTVSQLRGERRMAPLVAARHEAMWHLKVHHGISSTVIGRMLGGRDRTSVRWGVRRHLERVAAARRST